jgi:hypothetical protein
MLAAIAPLAGTLELTPAALMDQARAETGLDDFGPRDFVERLDVYCTALREEAGLSELGWFNNHTQLVKVLRNRLLVEDLVRRHPEILDLELAAPIIICGLPRTGSTHLHNLISADPGLRSLPYWESLEPVLPVAERPGPGDPDPRRERCQVGLDFLHAAMPLFDRMHEMTVDHVHEEIQLLLIDCSTMLMETSTMVPSWAAYYREHDQTSSAVPPGGPPLGPEVAAAPRAVPRAGRGLPRRDLRRDPPGSGRRDRLHDDDGHLRRAHERRPPRPARLRRLLGRPPRADAHRMRPRP